MFCPDENDGKSLGGVAAVGTVVVFGNTAPLNAGWGFEIAGGVRNAPCAAY